MKKLLLALLVSLSGLSAQAEPIDLTKYNLLWSDEFDALSLGDALPRNGKSWYTQQFWGGGFGSATFKPSTGDVWAIGPKGDATSALEIKLRRDTSGGALRSGLIDSMWPDGSTASGETTSRNSYYEGRMWLPDAIPGVWPGFWGVTQNYLPSFPSPKSAIELDILEFYGALGDRYTVTPHKWDFGPSSESNTRTFHAPANLLGGWHTYGIRIDDHGAQTYYFDGESFLFFGGRTSTWGSNYDTLINTPIGWMFNFAAGGGWPIDPELGLSKPASLWIDYFRIYKLAPTAFSTDFTITPTGQDITVIPGITQTNGVAGAITVSASGGADFNISALTGNGYALPSTGSLAHYIQATITNNSAGAGPLLAVRYTDEANWIGMRWSYNSIEIVKKVGGTASVMAGGTVAGPAAIGDVLRLEIDAGNMVRVLVNGTQRITPVLNTSATLTAKTPGLVPRTAVKLNGIDNLSSGPN